MDRIFFYTDPSLLISQAAGEAFGPVPSSPTTQYRTTNLHSASAEAPAFAVCNGFVAVHQGSAADELCLFLRPADPCFYDTKRICLVIYKGIRKDSLIHGDGTHIADEGANPLVDMIWQTHRSLEQDKAIYGETEQSRPQALSALGLGLLQDDNSPERFYYQRHETFQPMIVRKGTELGKFNSNAFAVQLVLGTDNPLPQISDLQSVDSVQIAVDPSQPATPQEQWQHHHERQQVLAYLDACAFFARYQNLGVDASIDNNLVTLSGDELADSILSKYASNQRWYIQIEEKIGQALGHNASIASTIAFRYDSNEWQADYTTHKWPIHLLDTTSFAVSDSTAQIELGLTLSSTTQRSLLGAMVAGAMANTYPQAPAGLERFLFLDTIDASSEFATLPLVIPSLAGGASRCGYHHLVFKERAAWFQPEHAPAPETEASNHPFDFLNHVFFPFKYRKSLFSENEAIQNRFFHANQLLEAPGRLQHAQLVATGVARDASHIFFCTIPLDQDWNRFEQQQNVVFLPEFINSKATSFIDLLNSKLRSVSVSVTPRTLADETQFNQLTLHYDNSLRPSLLTPRQSLFLISFSQSEFNSLIQIKENSNFLNEDEVSLSFKTTEHRLDAHGNPSRIMEPFLCGHILENGQLINRFVPTGLQLTHYEL